MIIPLVSVWQGLFAINNVRISVYINLLKTLIMFVMVCYGLYNVLFVYSNIFPIAAIL